MKRAVLGLAFVVNGFLTGARAAPQLTQSVNMEAGGGVAIEITSPFAEAPANGFVPVQFRVSNHSGTTRTYNIQTVSSASFMNGSQMTAFATLRVENDSESRTEMLLPVIPVNSGPVNYRSAQIDVSGYGVLTPQLYLPFHTASHGGAPTVFVCVSETLATRSWGSLEKELSDRSDILRGSQLDLNLLPPDWRALAGVQCLWLTPDDCIKLDAGRQTAIKDWITQGGVLYVCESKPDQLTRTEFGLRDPAGSSASVGFGEVRWFHVESEQELPADRAADEIRGLQNWQRDPFEPAQNWPEAKELGTLKLNAPFLLTFIGLFAVLVGPINLFYFAKADRRHRLFWTTPAISLAASLLLIGVIVLQDGFGGSGSRVSLTYLLPAQNKAVVMQEEAARTGVLFSRGFTIADDVYLAPVPFFANTKARQYQQLDKDYGGDWFASHSLQAQRIESIPQTRSRVQLLNAEPAKSGAPPVVVSSLPADLEELHYLDEAGHHWVGDHVHTGQPQTLERATDQSHLHVAATNGSYYLESLLQRVGDRAGNFYALANDGGLMATLPSIRWTYNRVIYIGPVTTDR